MQLKHDEVGAAGVAKCVRTCLRAWLPGGAERYASTASAQRTAWPLVAIAALALAALATTLAVVLSVARRALGVVLGDLGAAEPWHVPLAAHGWPAGYKPIRRVRYTTLEELCGVMKSQTEVGEPLVIEGTDIVDVGRWANLGDLTALLTNNTYNVKRSSSNRFRYYDLKLNRGKYEFNQPCEQRKENASVFVAEAASMMRRNVSERMYLQDTLSAQGSMAEEMRSWRWESFAYLSESCGMGFPNLREFFIGMQGVETPLHFDERENMFLQVRGSKEVVLFPFVDYLRLYPFPITHPCDRQSMVGHPVAPDLETFPRFEEALGYYGTLAAGDLLYLPYGWWHWMRTLEHLSVSVAFWSKKRPSTMTGRGAEHGLTVLRRSVEKTIAGIYGAEKHNDTMLGLRDAIRQGRDDSESLVRIRDILTKLKPPVPRDQQDAFLLDMVDRRFGVDWNKYVAG